MNQIRIKPRQNIKGKLWLWSIEIFGIKKHVLYSVYVLENNAIPNILGIFVHVSCSPFINMLLLYQIELCK